MKTRISVRGRPRGQLAAAMLAATSWRMIACEPSADGARHVARGLPRAVRIRRWEAK
jgi:hypothetical protein